MDKLQSQMTFLVEQLLTAATLATTLMDRLPALARIMENGLEKLPSVKERVSFSNI